MSNYNNDDEGLFDPEEWDDEEDYYRPYDDEDYGRFPELPEDDDEDYYEDDEQY